MTTRGALDLIREKIRFVIPPIFFVVCCLVLLFTYRLGSLRVDKGQTPGLRDIGTYFSGGLAILHGENPYENSYFRIGPIGGLLFGILAKIAPDFVAATLVMAISIFGFTYFVCSFAGYKNFRSFPWFFMGVLVFISSQRENLVNIQVTGILALFAAMGFRLLDKSTVTANLFSVAFLAIAIETKPHVLGLFVLVKLLENRRFRRISEVFVFITVLHIFLSIHIGNIISLEWFELISNLGSKASQGELPERIAFETLFELAGISSTTSFIISLSILTIFSLILLTQATIRNTHHLALIVPSLGIFFHYYDLALAFGLFLTILYRQRCNWALSVSIGLYMIPQNFFSAQNIYLFLLLLFILSAMLSERKLSEMLINFSLGLLSWCLYISVIRLMSSEVDVHELSMSLSIVYTMVGGIVLSLMNLSQSKTVLQSNKSNYQ